MKNIELDKKGCQLWVVFMVVLVLSLLFAACGIQPDPSSVNSTVSQGSSRTDQTTAIPADTKSQTRSVTPVPSPQLPSPTAIPTLTPVPKPTATPKPEPTTTPVPEPTVTLQPTATPEPKPTLSPTPDIYEGIGDSGRLNKDFYWISLDEKLKQRITGISYPADDSDSQIHYDDLRYIRLLHYDFEGNVHEGELIVHATLADEAMKIFHQLYLSQYPLTSVLLVDDFGQPADDTLSMEANNTSAFNYRYVTGTHTLSRHSFGAAIDINPMLNPYIVGDRIIPENGTPYADRSWDFPGKIDHDDLCYQLFINRGWTWGGDWSGDKDYQHFSKKINP